MGRERKFKGTDAEIALARFLCGITDSLGLDTVDKVAERFPQGGSRSKWAEYLNGAKLIPRPLLRDVLQEKRRTQPDGWSGNVIVEANKLWKAAAEGTPPPQDSPSTELVSVYRRLTETTEALNKAQVVAANSERVIPLLLQFSGRQEMKIAELSREVEDLRDSQRAEAARRLEQAQFRLARVQAELERARSDRYTAEQAQTVLLQEQQEALREIERLQQTGAELDHAEAEPMLLPDHAPEPEMSDEEIDRGMDERLDLIGTDREQRGVMLFEVMERAGMQPESDEDDSRTLPGVVVIRPAPTTEAAGRPAPPVMSDAVQKLSRTTPDNPPTSEDAPAHSPATMPEQRKTRRPRIWPAMPDLSMPELSRGTRSAIIAVAVPTVSALVVTVLVSYGPHLWSGLAGGAGPSHGTKHSNTPSASSPPASPTGRPDSNLPTDPPADPVSTAAKSIAVNTPKIMALKECTTHQADVTVKPQHSSYKWDKRPEILLTFTAKKDAKGDCRIDLGRKASVLTIKDADGAHVWSPADCPGRYDSPRWTRLTNNTNLTLTIHWDRHRSTPHCATTTSQTATAGTYLIQATTGAGQDASLVVLKEKPPPPQNTTPPQTSTVTGGSSSTGATSTGGSSSGGGTTGTTDAGTADGGTTDGSGEIGGANGGNGGLFGGPHG